jgi:hypothetical protein
MLNTLSFQPLEIISQTHEGHSSNDKCWPVYLNEMANQELHVKEGLSFLDKWKLLLNSKLSTVNKSYSLVTHCPQEVNVVTQTSAVLPCSRSSSHGTLPNVIVFNPSLCCTLYKEVSVSVTNALSQYLYHSPASLHGSCYKALKKSLSCLTLLTGKIMRRCNRAQMQKITIWYILAPLNQKTGGDQNDLPLNRCNS